MALVEDGRHSWLGRHSEPTPDELERSAAILRQRGLAGWLLSPIPNGHWKTTTFVAALRNSGMVAPMALDGPINGMAF